MENKSEIFRIFISQPMNNRTTKELLEERQEAIEDVKKICNETIKTNMDAEVMVSYINETPTTKYVPVWYLGKSIEIMSDASAVYFVDGWQNARGCCIEHSIALTYGIPILKD